MSVPTGRVAITLGALGVGAIMVAVLGVRFGPHAALAGLVCLGAGWLVRHGDGGGNR